MIIDTTLASYSIRLRCVQNYSADKAMILCYSPDKKTELRIIFQGESEEVGTARIDTFPALPGRARVVVFFPLSMLRTIHHVLQTEKPIRLYANNNNDYTQVSFGTGTEEPEPVGEEERGGI
jgi:hypothetical protein